MIKRVCYTLLRQGFTAITSSFVKWGVGKHLNTTLIAFTGVTRLNHVYVYIVFSYLIFAVLNLFEETSLFILDPKFWWFVTRGCPHGLGLGLGLGQNLFNINRYTENRHIQFIFINTQNHRWPDSLDLRVGRPLLRSCLTACLGTTLRRERGR